MSELEYMNAYEEASRQAELAYEAEYAERLSIVGTIPIDRLREIAAAEREGRLVVRPSCNECIHESVHYSKEPCYSCYGQDAIGEKGFCFEPRAEAALAGKGDSR